MRKAFERRGGVRQRDFLRAWGAGVAAVSAVFFVLAAGAARPAMARVEKVLYKFPGTSSNGSHPVAGLVSDSAGNLFGTTPDGGPSGGGTVFELVYDSGSKSYTEKVLYTFKNGNGDGREPQAGLLRDSAGNLFGTTQTGGSSADHCGTVFELVFDSAKNSYTEKVIYSFQGLKNGDGDSPLAGLVMDSDGNLFGTTSNGGHRPVYGGPGLGIVFELSPPASGADWTERVLYRFKGIAAGDGKNPQAGLVMDSHGNLFGTTSLGGSARWGTVFELSPPSGGGKTWKETVLHTFPGAAGDGKSVDAGLVRDSDGNLFGTTYGGGSSTKCMDGCGTAFELAFDSGKNSYTEKVIHSFQGDKNGDGQSPKAGLVRDSDGNLFGTTAGGFSGGGTVYELSPPSGGGTSWKETVLHSFPAAAGDGKKPSASLVRDSAGKLYGTTEGGGSGFGTVFELNPAAKAN